MVRKYRRKFSRRPFRSRRRSARAAVRIIRRRRSSYRRYQVHHFKRGVQKLSIAGNAINAPYVNALSFALSDLPNNNEFTNLFDQYKLNFVVVKFRLVNDPGAQPAAYNYSNMPELFWSVDRDDSSPPSSINELRERGTCKHAPINFNRWTKIALKPTPVMPVYNGGLPGSAYATTRGCRLDASYSGVPHYGLKFAIDNLQNTNYVVSVEAKYYVTCFNTR